LNVIADATWTVAVTQPRNKPASKVLQTYLATGDKVVGPFSRNGDNIRLTAQNMSSDGGSFVVTVYDSRDGSMQDIPFNKLGTFGGSQISNENELGPYYLGISSDGNWSGGIRNDRTVVLPGDLGASMERRARPRGSDRAIHDAPVLSGRVIAWRDHSIRRAV